VDEYLEGVPELMVEIAASSASYDLHDKRWVYQPIWSGSAKSNPSDGMYCSQETMYNINLIRRGYSLVKSF
jgi:Putative restriction endonuclease